MSQQIPNTTPTTTPNATPMATPNATPTATPNATPTATPNATPTATPNATPTATPNATPTATLKATDPDDDTKRFIRKCSLTIGNISKMANRFERRNNWFQFFLIYYSIVGIIDALIPQYFSLSTALPTYINNIFDFWDVLIAIVLLIFSSQVALFKYPEKIKSCVNKLNQLKSLMNGQSSNQIDYNTYNTIMDDIDFLFSRTDFYYSCLEYDKTNSKKKSEGEVSKHFRFFEIAFIVLKKWLENIFYFVLTILPIVSYIALILIWYNVKNK